MTSIPFDPGLALGQLVDPVRIDNLMQIADLQKPQDLANDRLNGVQTNMYKLRMIREQMIGMGVPLEDLDDVQKEIDNLKKEMIMAAVELGEATITSELAIFDLKSNLPQTTMTMQGESPVDFSVTQFKNPSLSFNTFKFDVQFYRKEKTDQSTSAFAASVATMIAGTRESDIGGVSKSETASASLATSINQTDTHSLHTLDGTLVITASCTHKDAVIMEPCVLHPVKTLDAWNAAFPNDLLSTDPMEMYAAAMNQGAGGDSGGAGGEGAAPPVENSLKILSGCTLGSSFVGMIHIFKREDTKTSDTAVSVAAAVKATVQQEIETNSMMGSFGVSASASTKIGSLLSTSQLLNSCSMTVRGAIPTIQTHTMETMVRKMDASPAETNQQMGAIMGATNTLANSSMDAQAGQGKCGAQFIALKNDHLANTVATLGEHDINHNQVLDANSLFVAFMDYVEKCKAGNAGVPINFYMKEINKADVAKNYIRTFYPNGVTTNLTENIMGAMGTVEGKK